MAQQAKKRKKQSCYQKFGKTEYRYHNTPLHKAGEGIAITPGNLRNWHERIGRPKLNHTSRT